jgi:prepilin peptidase CpaA
MLHTLSISLLPTLMIIAAFTDVASYKIPNWLTGLVALSFVPMAFLTGMPLADFGWHVLAGLGLFVLGYAGFAFGLFGGGDAKLLAAAGLWFGIGQSGSFIMLTALAGGVLAIGIGIWAGVMTCYHYYAADTEGGFYKKLKSFTPSLPYGIALCVGAVLTFPQTWWVTGA